MMLRFFSDHSKCPGQLVYVGTDTRIREGVTSKSTETEGITSAVVS